MLVRSLLSEKYRTKETKFTSIKKYRKMVTIPFDWWRMKQSNACKFRTKKGKLSEKVFVYLTYETREYGGEILKFKSFL